MNENSEMQAFHAAVCAMGALLFGVVCYIAYNSSLVPVMAEHIASIDKKIDEGFSSQGRRIDDHEDRIRKLEQWTMKKL